MFVFFFFFKQKTAYEMRISDWSSDVCSSDLPPQEGAPHLAATSKIVDLIEPVTPKPLLQRGRYVDPAGEDNDHGRRDRRPWLSFRQELDPPGDSIPAVHEVQALRRGGAQFILHQRKMRAGKDDGVHAIAAGLTDQAL